MSCARVREYASGATTWAKRSSPGDLAAWVGTAWGEDKNVCFVGSGADGAWSGFAVTGFGRKQSYNWGPDIDKMKDWIEDKWKEGMKITSWAVQDGKHFVVMTKDASLGGLFNGTQKWQLCGKWSAFQEYYSDGFKNGYCITSLCFDRITKKYIAVMTKAPNSQSVKVGSNFYRLAIWSFGHHSNVFLGDSIKAERRDTITIFEPIAVILLESRPLPAELPLLRAIEQPSQTGILGHDNEMFAILHGPTCDFHALFPLVLNPIFHLVNFGSPIVGLFPPKACHSKSRPCTISTRTNKTDVLVLTPSCAHPRGKVPWGTSLCPRRGS